MFAQVATCIIFFLMQVLMRPMFGAFGKAGSSNSIAFVSKVDQLHLFYMSFLIFHNK
jgi:urease